MIRTEVTCDLCGKSDFGKDQADAIEKLDAVTCALYICRGPRHYANKPTQDFLVCSDCATKHALVKITEPLKKPIPQQPDTAESLIDLLRELIQEEIDEQ